MTRIDKTPVSPARLTRRTFLTATGASLALLGCSRTEDKSESSGEAASNAAASSSEAIAKLAIEQSAWSYDADNDIYYQIGVPYCTKPAASAYESMGIYVPGPFFSAKENDDGTYTCTVNADAKVGSYTAKSAPVVLPINTAGYSAQEAPTEYSARGITDYTAKGIVYVYAGCRGRDNGENDDGGSFDGGAPWGVTDLKAAIRAIRLNDAALPGDKTRIFTFGHSGGGAQSALVGATGDATLYKPYLESIGAAFQDASGSTLSDAVCGSMCWCPITSLDVADEAYEWMMGQFADSGTRAEGTWTKLLSNDLADAFVSYINASEFEAGDSGVLKLTEGGEGSYTAGSYYDHVMSVIEGSLNHFLEDTDFPYTPSASTRPDGGFGGAGGGKGERSGSKPDGKPSHGPGTGTADGGAPDGGMPAGEPPSGDGAAEEDTSVATSGGKTPSQDAGAVVANSDSEATTYQDAQAYITALNGDESWIEYDASSNTAHITSLAAFVRHCKKPTKDVGAFDTIDRASAENKLFGTGDANERHFDATMAKLLEANATEYAAADGFDENTVKEFASDLKANDALGTPSKTRQDMYNPLFFLSGAYEGFGASTPAAHWRIRTGIEQGDTSLTTEINLALALAANKTVSDVDFETVWGQGHTTAERTGDSTSNFIAWIESCK